MTELTLTQKLANHLDMNGKGYYEPIQEKTKEMLEMDNILPLVMNQEVLKYYRNNVQGNFDTSWVMAERKITRAMHLSFQYKRDNKSIKNPRTWYSYGSLRFMVRNNEVKWMENNCKQFPMWYLDTEKYMQLSRALEIDRKHVRNYGTPTAEVVEVVAESKKVRWFSPLLSLLKSKR